jgi:biotin carboxyl carrier protein
MKTPRSGEGSRHDPWRLARSGGAVWVHFRGRTYRIEESRLGPERAEGSRREEDDTGHGGGRASSPPAEAAARAAAGAAAGAGVLAAPMPGVVLAVRAATGDRVSEGDVLVVLEAMKMEYEVRAGRDGTIAELAAVAGKRVEKGALLARIV